MARLTDGIFALGLMVGTTGALVIVSAFGLPTWLDSGATSTLLGAIVGGLLAMSAQIYAIRQQRNERYAELSRINESTSRSIFIKLVQIATNIHHLKNHIDEGISVAKSEGYFRNHFLFIRPISGDITKVYITEQEKSLIIEWREIDLFNNIIHVDWIHNSLSDDIKEYKEMRHEALANLEANSTTGLLSLSEMSSEQYARFESRAAGVSDLISQIIFGLERDYSLCQETLLSMADAIERHTGKTFTVKTPARTAAP